MLAPPIQPTNAMAFHGFSQPPKVSQSTNYGSRPYAIPAQNPVHGFASRSGGLTYAEHELLRQRKTPRGRLCEEYEASTLDKNLELPASKHVLLSLSPRDDTHYMQRPKHGYTSSDLGGRVHSQSIPTPNLVRGAHQFPPAWEFPGGIDSVIHQNLPIQAHRPHHLGRSNVPTVLPAALQSPMGPTVSAGQQFFGPYWPDGTFTPYRPAPIRDNRFFGDSINHGHIPSAQNNVTPHTHHLRRSTRFPSFAHAQNVTSPGFGVNFTASLPPRDSVTPYASFNERIASALNIPNAPYGLNDPMRGQANYSTETIRAFPPLDSVMLKPNDASDRIAFRDKTFAWAHRVYVDLLTRIHQENKLGKQYPGLSIHLKPSAKPAIYPKPPQRNGSHFSDPIAPNGNLKTTHSPYNQNTPDLTNTTHFERNRPSTAIRTTPGQVPGIDSQPTSQTSQHTFSYSPRQLTSDNVYPIATLPQSSANYVCTSGNEALSPFVATSALDSMEVLCREAEKPWTDGMLLAGCLAYGLGNYPKALSWYQSILSQDPRHVEAMSNLAATLLALGRREEALQHWSFAVRLRPSYFEAVEHLIGLLCSSHRAREAVDIIEYVESSLKVPNPNTVGTLNDDISDAESDSRSRASSTTMASSDYGLHEYEVERRGSVVTNSSDKSTPGFGSSGYAIRAAENGRLLALIHAKGNMLYALNNNEGAAAAFEEAVLIATGRTQQGIRSLIENILRSCVSSYDSHFPKAGLSDSKEPILLTPERAQQTAQRMFPPSGDLPGLESVPAGIARKAAVSTTSNSLLSLAKIYQDGMCAHAALEGRRNTSTREILALYYLSLSLQPSPSTANNVGILLASVQYTAPIQVVPQRLPNQITNYTGVVPGSGTALALAYYNYGLNLDGKHAHLYTNLGSLLKDLGQLNAAIKMYETAVSCDGTFDIALANLANAVKDQGRIADAITYYRRAVQANPDFAEAVCGLATALNSVCNWYGRGGVYADKGSRDRIHVDDYGMMREARKGSGWMNRVVEIVEKQLRDGESWGVGTLNSTIVESLCQQISFVKCHSSAELRNRLQDSVRQSLMEWAGQRWEGSRVVRLIERATKAVGWQWYQDRYRAQKEYPQRKYARPTLPASLTMPNAPTVLPFHTFTTPLSAKQVRQISQRNALRISVSTLRSSWLPQTVYPPPAPPNPHLRVGYVSSDFNNHPLAHLMQSVFGIHDQKRVQAYCYATTESDKSIHREQIEREAPVFHDASSWNVERLVNQIVKDGIHILVNLNGYTRGARNEVFAARPAPIHMSFMGFAGTLGAEWCDYVYADSISVLPQTLSPWRRNVEVEDRLHPDALAEDEEDWVYSENVIFSKSSFFCVDHKQSAPDAKDGPPRPHDTMFRENAWNAELDRRWKLRKELFPNLSDNAVILGNFNQLYKIDPTTFRMYLRILAAVPNAILWLLRFPDVGEQNLLAFAKEWAGADIAQRIIFTDVAPKGTHITRASVVDLFLDTPECNAHTTAADVIWSGTPIVTWARWEYKMCSRMASSIVASALPEGEEGDEGRKSLLVNSEHEYEEHAISLASSLRYPGVKRDPGRGHGKLMNLRRILWEGRWTSRLFDTKRWVKDLEKAYWEAWRRWEIGEGGDIWL